MKFVKNPYNVKCEKYISQRLHFPNTSFPTCVFMAFYETENLVFIFQEKTLAVIRTWGHTSDSTMGQKRLFHQTAM